MMTLALMSAFQCKRFVQLQRDREQSCHRGEYLGGDEPGLRHQHYLRHRGRQEGVQVEGHHEGECVTTSTSLLRRKSQI